MTDLDRAALWALVWLVTSILAWMPHPQGPDGHINGTPPTLVGLFVEIIVYTGALLALWTIFGGLMLFYFGRVVWAFWGSW